MRNEKEKNLNKNWNIQTRKLTAKGEEWWAVGIFNEAEEFFNVCNHRVSFCKQELFLKSSKIKVQLTQLLHPPLQLCCISKPSKSTLNGAPRAERRKTEQDSGLEIILISHASFMFPSLPF